VKYGKLPLSIPEHIEQLKNRNLIIDDGDKAKFYLKNIGYYRLSAYFIPFEQQTKNSSRNHNFIKNTNFNDIINLYIFDRKLRLLIMEAIERIEVAVRSNWVNELSLVNKNAHAYTDDQLFSDPTTHNEMLQKIKKEMKRSKETYITHYNDKYTEPNLPPTWAMAESLTFGSLSLWVSSTKNTKIKSAIAKNIGLPNTKILEAVLHTLTYLRNLSAHHSRIWNRKFTIQLPKIKSFGNDFELEIIGANGKENQQQTTRYIYNYLIVLIKIMQHIQPNTTWTDRLSSHILTINEEHHSKMGFPNDWQNKDIWKTYLKP